jgi:hypothetical protein
MTSFYLSPGSGAPSRTQPSASSSSQDTVTSQRYPAPLQPRTLGTTRPNVYSNDNLWGSPSKVRLESKMFYEEEDYSEFDQPQPLSYPFASFVDDMRTISMPDLNEFFGSVIAQSNARQAARQPRGNTELGPYPTHNHDVAKYSRDGTHRACSESIRQATAEDFLRPQHPLPAPPIEEYDSDQDLPVIEPDSHEYFLSAPKGYHLVIPSPTPDPNVPTRRSTTANARSRRIFGLAPAPKRTQSILVGPSQAPSLANEQSASEQQDSLKRDNTMGNDMYQPALGGLQSTSRIQRKDSKRDRVKRFMNGLNPFRRHREFGRASKHKVSQTRSAVQ